MKIRVSHRARADLEEIWRYSSRNWGEEHADLFIDLLVMRFAWLTENRGLWRDRSDLGPSLFTYTEKSHVIYFMHSTASLKIARLLHVSMDPELRLK